MTCLEFARERHDLLLGMLSEAPWEDRGHSRFHNDVDD
jgi:hypothetical protein